jgi:hypothetical protein
MTASDELVLLQVFILPALMFVGMFFWCVRARLHFSAPLALVRALCLPLSISYYALLMYHVRASDPGEFVAKSFLILLFAPQIIPLIIIGLIWWPRSKAETMSARAAAVVVIAIAVLGHLWTRFALSGLVGSETGRIP